MHHVRKTWRQGVARDLNANTCRKVIDTVHLISYVDTMNSNFRNKTVEDILTWLEDKGYNEWVREGFEGLVYFLQHGSTAQCML